MNEDLNLFCDNVYKAMSEGGCIKKPNHYKKNAFSLAKQQLIENRNKIKDNLFMNAFQLLMNLDLHSSILEPIATLNQIKKEIIFTLDDKKSNRQCMIIVRENPVYCLVYGINHNWLFHKKCIRDITDFGFILNQLKELKNIN